VFRCRMGYAEMTQNPLRKQHIVQSGELSDLVVPEEN